MVKTSTKTKIVKKSTKPVKKASVKTVKKTPVKKKVASKKVDTSVAVKTSEKIAVSELEKDKKSRDIFAITNIAKSQHKLYEGKTYEIKKIEGKVGDNVEIEEVLLVAEGDKVLVGKPFIKGAKVSLKIVSQKKGPKVDSFTFKAKARYRRTRGSRPLLTGIKVEKISY